MLEAEIQPTNLEKTKILVASAKVLEADDKHDRAISTLRAAVHVAARCHGTTTLGYALGIMGSLVWKGTANAPADDDCTAEQQKAQQLLHKAIERRVRVVPIPAAKAVEDGEDPACAALVNTVYNV